jgi:hypothetical protein
MLVAHMARIYCGTSHGRNMYPQIYTNIIYSYSIMYIVYDRVLLWPMSSGRRVHGLTISCCVSCIGACITNVDDQILQKALTVLIKVRRAYMHRFLMCLR